MTLSSRRADANTIAAQIANGAGFELLRRPCPPPENRRGFQRWTSSLQSCYQQLWVLRERLVQGAFLDHRLMGRVERRIDSIQSNAPKQERASIQKIREALSTESVIEEMRMRVRPAASPTSASLPTFKGGLLSTVLQAALYLGSVTPVSQICAGRAFSATLVKEETRPSTGGPVTWFANPVESVRNWWRSAPQLPSKAEPKAKGQKAQAVVDRSVDRMKGKENPKVKRLKKLALKLRDELAKTMRTTPADTCPKTEREIWTAQLDEQCFAIETLESDLAHLMDEIRYEILPEDQDQELLRFGNKHANLVKMARAQEVLQLPDLIIPMPRGISTDQTQAFLEKRAPDVLQLWKEIGEMGLSLDSQEARSRLTQIDQMLEIAFSSPDAYKDLALSPEMHAWLDSLKQAGDSLMVRSTGAEDSHQAANAGGNVSKAYVSPTPTDLCEAVGAVVRSYFSQSSLQNRVNAGMNPFKEKLSLAVTAQQLIGEPVGGTQDPNQIPVAFAVFTSEPLYVGGEKFRVMRISATNGHGAGVVGDEAEIRTDTVLVLHSESQPAELYCLYNNQKKPQRLAPLQKGDRVVLGKIDNDPYLAKKPSLCAEQIMKIYASAIPMEAAFGNHPTDIEGIMKGGNVYFVQSRPVNRKPLLPTYLDPLKGKNGIVSKLQAEMLVPGKGSAVSITSPEEVLFAPTLQEAEKNFRPANHKLVIVAHSEPENSHPVVNFSEQGIPCLHVSDSEALKILLAKVGPDQPLVACMQTARLYLWDSSKGSLEESIAEGFAVHPAKIAISLPIPDNLKPFITPSAPPDIKDLFLQIQGAEGRKKALRLLNQLENHPLIRSLRSQVSSPVPGVAERVKALQELDLQIHLAIDESRAVIQKRGSTPLKKLIRLKALGSLLFGPSRGLGQFTLMDAEPLITSIAQLSAYQRGLSHPAHLIDLALDGQRAHSDAYGAWEGFLMELEPLIESGKVSAQEGELFKEQIGILRDSSTLPFWLTFFQGNSSPTDIFSAPREERTLERFKQIMDVAFTQSDKVLVHSLLKEQQAIRQMGSQLSRFAEPGSFWAALTELEGHIGQWRSQEMYDSIKAAPPIVQAVGFKTLRDGVTLLDSAIKTMKASSQFDDQTKLDQFKRMVRTYADLMKSVGEGLIGANRIPHNARWPLDNYLNQFDATLNHLIATANDPAQLRASPNFSVSAAIITARTAFDRHLPETIEDAMTAAHQNLEAFLAIGNEGILTPDQIHQSHLPKVIKQAIQDIEKTDWGRRIERVGIEIGEEEIVIRYNVPLRNHSGHIDLRYDIHSRQLTFKAQLLGRARQRWGEIADWVRTLEAASIFHSERPLSQGEQELTFSWEISSPDSLKIALREYVAMAEYSLRRQPLFAAAMGNLFTRWENRQEIERLTDYFLKTPNPSAGRFYEYYLDNFSRVEKEKLAVALLNSIGSDKAEAWWDFLRQNGVSSKEALAEAVQKSSFSEVQKDAIQHFIDESSSEKPLFDFVVAMVHQGNSSWNRSYLGVIHLCIHFVNQGYVHQEFIQLAETIIKSVQNEFGFPAESLVLFKALVEKGYGYEAALQAAKAGMAQNTSEVMSIIKILAEKEYGHKEIVEILTTIVESLTTNDPNTMLDDFELSEFQEILDTLASKGLDCDLWILAEKLCNTQHYAYKHEGVNLFKKLFRKGYGHESALKTANELWGKNENFEEDRHRLIALRLFNELVKTGVYEKAYPVALQTAMEGVKTGDLNTKDAAERLLLALVEKGYGYEEISAWASSAIYNRAAITRSISLRLFEILIRKKYGYKAAREAALAGTQDSEQRIRERAALLLTLLGAKKQSSSSPR